MTRWLTLAALLVSCVPDADLLDTDMPLPGFDSDGDGLSDVQETVGWTLLIDFAAFGLHHPEYLSRREVTSDPYVADTDGDGLTDLEEFLAKSDPQVEDTDLDGLLDADEVLFYGTSPSSVDTDGDSRGPNPQDPLPPDARLFDLGELDLDPFTGLPSALATSPLHADTDGDGIDDLTELRDGGRDPRIAELPLMGVEIVDALDVRVRVDFSETGGTTERFGASYETSTGTTDSTVEETTRGRHREITQRVDADFTLGIPPGIHIKTTTTYEFGESFTGVNSTTEGSFDAFSTAAQQARSGVEKAGTANARGEMSVGVRLSNPGTLTYEARDLAVVVRQYAYDSDTFRTVAVLQPPAGFDAFTMASGSSTPVIPFTVSDLSAEDALVLMENPRTVFIEPASYALAGADGRDYGFIAEEAYNRTATVVVDDGFGLAERTRVASGLLVDGEPRPANLVEVLERLGHTVETRTQGATGRSLLYALDGQAVETHEGVAPDLGDPPYPEGLDPGQRLARQFWAVIGNRPDGLLPMEGDFADIALLPRDQLSLVWTRDLDRDGLSDHEESLHGARDSAIHSDGRLDDPLGDGLSDWFEVRVGWEVAAWRSDGLWVEHAYPSPMVRDSDGDGWDDGVEYLNRTHPLRADTDGDSVIDSLDDQPLVFVNSAPELDIELAQVLNQFTVTGGVSDAEGNLVQVSINWGDGSSDNVFDGFDALGWTHTYATDGPFTITVTARDSADLTTTQQLNVTSVIVPTDTLWEELFNGPQQTPPLGACLVDLEPPRTHDNAYVGSCLRMRCGYNATGDACYNSSNSSETDFDEYNNSGRGRANLELGASLTMTGWVRKGQYNWGTGFVFGEMGYPAVIGTEAGQFIFVNRLSNPDAGLTLSTTGTFPDNEWWFLAAVLTPEGSGSRATLYWQPMDGVMQSVSATSPGTEAGSDACGIWAATYSDRERWNIPPQCSMANPNTSDWPQFYFDGYVDDVRMFSRALSVNEISALAELR